MGLRSTSLGSAGTATALILMALAGCDRPSAVETRERASADAPMALASTPEAAGAENRGAAAPKPVLTANRRETTDAKVARLFERNGAAFDARTPDDYLAKVEAFTAKPPRDVETVKRPNGDTLIYQASTNTFAVVARDGTARTMFKPTTGAAYWAEQKAAAPTFGRRRQSTDAAG